MILEDFSNFDDSMGRRKKREQIRSSHFLPRRLLDPNTNSYPINKYQQISLRSTWPIFLQTCLSTTPSSKKVQRSRTRHIKNYILFVFILIHTSIIPNLLTSISEKYNNQLIPFRATQNSFDLSDILINRLFKVEVPSSTSVTTRF